MTARDRANLLWLRAQFDPSQFTLLHVAILDRMVHDTFAPADYELKWLDHIESLADLNTRRA